MPKKLNLDLEANAYPTWEVFFNKVPQEEGDLSLRFELEVIETLPSGSSTTVYHRTLTGEEQIQQTRQLSFSDFSLCLLAGKLVFSELEKDCNLVVETEGEVCFSEDACLAGSLVIKNASQVINKVRLEAQETLGICCATLINHGYLLGGKLSIVDGGVERRKVSLDNRNGMIQSRESLMIQANSLDNQQGKMIAQQLNIQATGQLNNQRGMILAKKEAAICLRSHFNNLEGQLESEEGNISIRCETGRIVNRHYGSIRSRTGRVVLEASFVETDEMSLVHGKIQTKIIGKKKLRQESILSGDQLHLESDQLDLNAGIASQQQLNITASKRRLTLVKPIASLDKMSITAPDLDLRSRLISNRADVSAQSGLQYKPSSFCIRQALNFSLQEGVSLTTPVKVLGSLSINLSDKAKGSLEILTDIRVGLKDGEPSQFVLKAPQNAVRLGREGFRYCTVYASGNVDIQAQSFDLIHGRIIGQKELSVTSNGSLSLGRLTPPSGMPSGLISEGRLVLCSKQESILIQQATVQTRSALVLDSPKQVDNVSGSLSSLGDCLIEAPLFKHRIPVQYTAGGVKTNIASPGSHAAYKTSGSSESAMGSAATLTVGKNLITKGQTEILGSQIHHNGFQGLAPKQANFIPVVNWSESFLCGHKKVRKAQWYHYQKQTLGTPFLSLFSSGKALQLINPMLDIAGIVFAPGLQLSGFSQGRVGWQRFDIRLPRPKAFQQRVALDQFAFPQPGYFLRESTGVFESVLASYISPTSVPMTLLRADGSLAVLEAPVACQLPAELQAELIVKVLMSEMGRGFLDALHTTPESIYHKLQENAYEFLSCGQGIAGFNASRQPAWIENLQQPILVYRQKSVLNKMLLTPDLIFPSSWDNPALRDWAGGLFSFSHISIEGNGRDSAVFTITAHLNSQNKIKFRDLSVLNQTKQLYRKMISYDEVRQQSSCFGLSRKTIRHSRQAACIELQPGNTLRAVGVEYDNIGSLNMVGLEMDLGAEGVVSQGIGSISEQPARASTVEVHQEEHLHLLRREKATVGKIKEEILASHLRSQGSVELSADRAVYRSVQLVGEQQVSLSGKEHLELSASKKTVHRPSQVVKEGRVKHCVSGSYEEGVPVVLSAAGDIVCHSEGTFNSFGTQISGRNISLSANQEMIQAPLLLNQWSVTKSRGVRGLTAFRSQDRQHHESGLPPVLIAEGSIEIQSKKGNVLLIAPLFFAGGKISLLAPKGEVTIQPASFYQDMSSQQTSIALNFFGSEAVESILRRDCLGASKALLREFPLLRGLEEGLRSKDIADKVGSGLKILYQFHHALETLIHSKNLKDFINKQWSFDPRMRAGYSAKTAAWVELALPWLQAQTILLAAEKVKASGLQAEAQHLQISASKQVVLSAASQSRSERSHQEGVTVGFQKGVLYGGVDFHRENTRALEYLHAHFNVGEQFSISSEGGVSLQGVYVKTLRAVIEAESLCLETLQDKYQHLGYGASVSSAANGSITFNRQAGEWASEQSGLEAAETLLVNIRKELTLLGAKLQVSGSKPLIAKLAPDESLTLYEYPLAEGFATAYPVQPERINLRVWQRNREGALEILSVRNLDEALPTLDLHYRPETDDHTFLYPKPGLLRASAITHREVVDSHSSQGFSGSLDISGCFARGNWLKAVGEGNYRRDKASQINRATIADDIAIFTQHPTAITVNRSSNQARSRDDSHCHYRGFALVGDPKKIARQFALPFQHKELLVYKAGRYLKNILDMAGNSLVDNHRQGFLMKKAGFR